MKGSPATAAIFEALHANRATAKERHAEMERKIRQVAAMFALKPAAPLPMPSGRIKFIADVLGLMLMASSHYHGKDDSKRMFGILGSSFLP